MTTCSIRQPPSPTMRRRLRRSAERGWLVRLHHIDCTHLTGTVSHIDLSAMRCLLTAPGSLWPEHEIDLEEVCDVQVVAVALVHGGRPSARFAVIAPWQEGSPDPGVIIADLMSGSAGAGESGPLLLDDGVRRHGTITAMHGARCRIVLTAPA